MGPSVTLQLVVHNHQPVGNFDGVFESAYHDAYLSFLEVMEGYGEIPFVLRYDQKKSNSKVVTSLTTLGYLVLIAKFCVPWGDIGKRWMRDIEARKRRVYGADGRLLEPARRTS